MKPLELNDGTKLVNFEPQEKKNLEKDMEELLVKHNAVILPILDKDISSIRASIAVYKKVANEEQENAKETDDSTEKSS